MNQNIEFPIFENRKFSFENRKFSFENRKFSFENGKVFFSKSSLFARVKFKTNTDDKEKIRLIGVFLLIPTNTSRSARRYQTTHRQIYQFIYLTADFDPTRSDGGVPLSGDTGYTFNQANLEYRSNNTNLLTYSVNTTLGQFFNGNRYSVGGTLAYRVQPWAQFSLNINYDGIRLPDPHPSADLWLVTPRIDVTFSKSVFWTTLIQYSNQRDNLGINSRLQWRFAPLSDFYLVYNDNYFTTDFAPRFRSINLKVSYWLNL